MTSRPLPHPDRLPYLTGTAGALLIAFSGIFVRLAGEAPATAAVFRCAYALPFLALLAARERRRYGPRPAAQRRLAGVAGIFFAADLVLWHYSIEYVGAGLGTVLGNTQVVFVGLAAWALLGERPDRRVVIAVPVMVAGVLLISGVLEEEAYGADPLLGVVFGTLTALAYAGFLLVLRHGNQDRRRPAGPLFDATAVAAVGSAAAGFAVGDVSLAPAWPSHGWLVLLAVTSQVFAWLLISVSLPRLPAVVTSVLLMLQPVGAVALAMVLLAEAPSALQLAGCVAVLTGIVVATVTRRPGLTPTPIDAAPVDAASVSAEDTPK
jgi:drug/metabolite transporter (DMT)-like permease